MKQIFALALISVISVAQADVYHLYWDKSKTSGSFTDETMWLDVNYKPSPDFDKGSNRFFRIESKKSATNTVCLADYNLLGGINYYVWKDSSLILDGRDVWFRQHSADETALVNNTGNYGPFTLRDNNYNLTAFQFDSSDLAHASTISFSNSLASTGRPRPTSSSGRFKADTSALPSRTPRTVRIQ